MQAGIHWAMGSSDRNQGLMINGLQVSSVSRGDVGVGIQRVDNQSAEE